MYEPGRERRLDNKKLANFGWSYAHHAARRAAQSAATRCQTANLRYTGICRGQQTLGSLNRPVKSGPSAKTWRPRQPGAPAGRQLLPDATRLPSLLPPRRLHAPVCPSGRPPRACPLGPPPAPPQHRRHCVALIGSQLSRPAAARLRSLDLAGVGLDHRLASLRADAQE